MLNRSTFLRNAVPAMKLIIDREKWLRGEESDNSFLLRKEDKKMCCLGFYALACGLDQIDICQKREPVNVCSLLSGKADWLLENGSNGLMNSTYASELMCINDVDGNEEKITKIFADNGVEVEFIN